MSTSVIEKKNVMLKRHVENHQNVHFYEFLFVHNYIMPQVCLSVF